MSTATLTACPACPPAWPTFDDAYRAAESLAYYGETGHVSDWHRWAREAMAAADILFTWASSILDAHRFGPQHSGALEVTRDARELRTRLMDAYAARNAESLAWPKWAGPGQSLARFRASEVFPQYGAHGDGATPRHTHAAAA
jgi:hypothetical protein